MNINAFFSELVGDNEAFQHSPCCGCIPTCVRNILKYYGIKKQNGEDWTQKDVIEYFNKLPPQPWRCQFCGNILSEAPTFRIMKEFEKYPPFGEQYQVKISPDEDDEEIKKEVLVSGEKLRNYILEKLFEIIAGDFPKPVLITLMPQERVGSHSYIVTELDDYKVNLFDPRDRKEFISWDRKIFDGFINLRDTSDYSRICYVYNRY